MTAKKQSMRDRLAAQAEEPQQPTGYPFVRWDEPGKEVVGVIEGVRRVNFKDWSGRVLDVRVDPDERESLDELAEEESEGAYVTVVLRPYQLAQWADNSPVVRGANVYIRYAGSESIGGGKTVKRFETAVEPPPETDDVPF